MRVEKKEECIYELLEPDSLREILGCYSSLKPRDVIHHLVPIRLYTNEGEELLLVEENVWRALRSLKCENIFTLGLHIASIRRNRVYLHLALGSLLEHVITHNYVVLPEPLVRKLLYGKPVVVTNVEYNLESTQHCPKAVLDEDRRFVAWARVEENNGKLLIKPLIDVGWYLRSGV